MDIDLLRKLDDLVEELRREGTIKLRPNVGEQILSRSEVVCDCVKHVLS